jgi:hypothetical protein
MHVYPCCIPVICIQAISVYVKCHFIIDHRSLSFPSQLTTIPTIYIYIPTIYIYIVSLFQLISHNTTTLFTKAVPQVLASNHTYTYILTTTTTLKHTHTHTHIDTTGPYNTTIHKPKNHTSTYPQYYTHNTTHYRQKDIIILVGNTRENYFIYFFHFIFILFIYIYFFFLFLSIYNMF